MFSLKDKDRTKQAILMKHREITVRLTKQLVKDLDDLERCVAGCDNARDRKTLERVSKNLRKHFGVQSGGVAPITDPAAFNLSGLINTDGNPIDAGAAGAGLMNVPAPFYEGNTMFAGQLFSETTGASFVPAAYQPTLPAQAGGAAKKKASKSKTKGKKHA